VVTLMSLFAPSSALAGPLHNAAFNGNRAVVELLIARGADVNATDYTGRTPLRCAARKGHQDIIVLLEQFGAAE
jgi:ankyrin repeat protein